jgi:hypothetical protein
MNVAVAEALRIIEGHKETSDNPLDLRDKVDTYLIILGAVHELISDAFYEIDSSAFHESESSIASEKAKLDRMRTKMEHIDNLTAAAEEGIRNVLAVYQVRKTDLLGGE